MYGIEEYRNDIERSLDYIIKREDITDIPKDEYSYEYSDTIDYYDKIYTDSGNKSFIIFLYGKYFEIGCTMDTKTAKYIIENIHNIEYVYCENDGTDTILGNVKDIMKEHNFRTYAYLQFIKSLNYVPKKSECLNFLEGLNM